MEDLAKPPVSITGIVDLLLSEATSYGFEDVEVIVSRFHGHTSIVLRITTLDSSTSTSRGVRKKWTLLEFLGMSPGTHKTCRSNRGLADRKRALLTQVR